MYLQKLYLYFQAYKHLSNKLSRPCWTVSIPSSKPLILDGDGGGVVGDFSGDDGGDGGSSCLLW